MPLLASDAQVIKEALFAAARGPFFDDWEFQTLFGIARSEVAAAADTFSAETAESQEVRLAVHSTLNNLVGYPHGQESVWSNWLSVSPAELGAVFDRWRARRRES